MVATQVLGIRSSLDNERVSAIPPDNQLGNQRPVDIPGDAPACLSC